MEIHEEYFCHECGHYWETDCGESLCPKCGAEGELQEVS